MGSVQPLPASAPAAAPAASFQCSSALVGATTDPSPPFPKNGVRLSHYQSLYRLCGGRDKLAGKTTGQVCTEFVIPLTAAKQNSFCDLLVENGDPAVGIAQVFVSHAWQYLFLDVLDSLLLHFKGDLDVIVWFDLFSNSQHIYVDYGFDWWCNVFRTAIEDFGYVVMVLCPWRDPIPFKRAWCLFELYCSAVGAQQYAAAGDGAMTFKFEVAMSIAEETKFLEDISQNTWATMDHMLAQIDCKRSIATNMADRKKIHAVVENSIGFSHINSLVFAQLRKWAIVTTERAVNAETDPLQRIVYEMALAELYAHQGQFNEAERLHRKCWNSLIGQRGLIDPMTIQCGHRLALVWIRKGSYKEAQTMLEACYYLQCQRAETTDAEKATTMKELANVYHKMGHPYTMDAAKWVQACHDMMTAIVAAASTATANAKSNASVVVAGSDPIRDQAVLAEIKATWAWMSINKGRDLPEAEEMLKESQRMYASVYGSDHPIAMGSLCPLAILYCKQGRFDLAKSTYESCLEHHVVKLGTTHPMTLSTKVNMARMYADWPQNDNQASKKTCSQQQQKLRFYKEAESLYTECLETQVVVCGNTNIDSTVKTMYGLASLYERQREFAKAEPLIRSVLDIQTKELGKHHPSALASMSVMAKVLEGQGDYAAAEVCQIECLNRNKELPEKESHEASRMIVLAKFYIRRQRTEDAIKLLEEVVDVSRANSRIHLTFKDRADCLFLLGKAYEKCGQKPKALESFQKCRRDCVKELGANNATLKSALNEIRRLEALLEPAKATVKATVVPAAR